MNLPLANIQSIDATWAKAQNISLDILRLDKIHPIVSGNKYFKLKYYLQEAKLLGAKTIATFGGAWSNHIVATAFACKEAGLHSIGIIRGEQPSALSATLQSAASYEMKLYFATREEYRNKELLKIKYENDDVYWINEGGLGEKGVKGASEILQLVDAASYTHIIASVGTGTMLSGLITAAKQHQKIIGISSLKGNKALNDTIIDLTAKVALRPSFEIIHDYHFGGYGKHPQPLIEYINKVYKQYQLPLDIVYTGKTFYAIEDLVVKNYFAAGSKLLMIHSGGLQGNNSLPVSNLAF